MKLVVGLGNPGRKYAGTRHNVGFEVVDALAARHRLEWEAAPAEALIAKWRAAGALLVKPLTFMNLSGHAVGDLLRYYKVDLADLLVIVDEVQLELGPVARAGQRIGRRTQRAQVAHRAAGDRRVRAAAGSAWDAAMRAGTSPITCSPTFDKDEQPVVSEAIARAADAAEVFVSDGLAPMMNRFNRREDREEDSRQ